MDKDCTCGRVYLNYTEQEWEMLEEIARNKHRADFASILIGNISKVAAMNDMSYHPVGGGFVRKSFLIPAGTSCQLVELSRQYGIGLATLISRFVVSPLIRQHYEDRGFLTAL